MSTSAEYSFAYDELKSLLADLILDQFGSTAATIVDVLFAYGPSTLSALHQNWPSMSANNSSSLSRKIDEYSQFYVSPLLPFLSHFFCISSSFKQMNARRKKNASTHVVQNIKQSENHSFRNRKVICTC